MLRYCKCAPASREGTVTHSVGVWGREGWVWVCGASYGLS